MNKFIRLSSFLIFFVTFIVFTAFSLKPIFAAETCITYYSYSGATTCYNNGKIAGKTCRIAHPDATTWKCCCSDTTTTTTKCEPTCSTCKSSCDPNTENSTTVGCCGTYYCCTPKNAITTTTSGGSPGDWYYCNESGRCVKRTVVTDGTTYYSNSNCDNKCSNASSTTVTTIITTTTTLSEINSCHKCNGTKYCGTVWTVAKNELCNPNIIPSTKEENQIVCGDCTSGTPGSCEGKSAEDVETYCNPTSENEKCTRCSDTYKNCRVTYDPTNGTCGTGIWKEGELLNKNYTYDPTCFAGSVIAACSTAPTLPDCDETDKVTETDCTAAGNVCGPEAGTKSVTYSPKDGGRECRENTVENVKCEINTCRSDQECINNQCQCRDPQKHDPYWVCNTTNYSCQKYEGVCGTGYLSEASCKSGCRTTTTKTVTTTTNSGTSTTRPNTTSSTIPGTTTTTKASNNTLTFVLGLDGIGTTGDNANPDDINCTEAQRQQGCGSTLNPTRPSRQIFVDFYDTTDKSLNTLKTGYVDFQTASGSANYGKFVGTVDLGTSFTSGNYIVRTWSEGYLKRRVPGILAVNTTSANQAPKVRLVTGDMDVNNKLDINDYADLVSCIEGFNSYDATKCNSNARFKTIADLDDNGTRNEFDYNLYMRDWANQQGE